MKKALKFLILSTVISLGFASQSFADVRHYTASIDKSAWLLSTESRLQCTLSHNVPRYGQANFSSFAKRDLNMLLELDMLKMPAGYDMASVQSIAPKWKPGVPTRQIADMKILKQFNGELPERATWTILSELEKGMMPTFYYDDFYSPYDKIAVGLNAANFGQAYEAFLTCIDNLLPFSFEDIAFTVLSYQTNTAELTKASKKRLAMIGEYLQNAPELDLVLLSGYTDSYGGRWHNEQLSKKRANTIRTFFEEKGVNANRIEVSGYGEKRHISGNSNILDRAKNRRVVIQLEKQIEI